MLERKQLEMNNTLFGLERIKNMLKLLKLLMKPVSSFNISPLVPHSPKLKQDMTLSKRDLATTLLMRPF